MCVAGVCRCVVCVSVCMGARAVDGSQRKQGSPMLIAQKLWDCYLGAHYSPISTSVILDILS